MLEFPKLPIITPPPQQNPKFPDLPILEPDPPRMSLREKFGGLYYLAIGGLIASLFLVGTFFYQFYRTRDLWAAVYVLYDETASVPARNHAAWMIAHNPDANDRQKMTFALQTTLPELTRYIIAEGLSPEAIQADPKAYALMAARSEPWPDWLRLMVARPMAYAVGEGYRIAWEPLDELRGRSDKAMGLWMTYTRAVMGSGEAALAQQLRDAAAKPGAYQPLANLLSQAEAAKGAERVAKLDAATAWLRGNHPPCSQVWEGWKVVDGELVVDTKSLTVPAPAAAKAAGSVPVGDKAQPER